MDVNNVALFGIILSVAVLIYLERQAHGARKHLVHQLSSVKERLAKLAKLVEDVEKVEKQMHVAAVEKVDKRNLDMIIRETLDFISEKERAVAVA